LRRGMAAPLHRTPEHGAVPPELVVFYSGLNATEMRLALDAPELADEWVLAHQQHLDSERREAEEEEARQAADKV